MAESLGGVPHRGPGPVAHDDGDEGRALAAVAAVDVLDDLLAPAALDVHVDVGGAVALGDKKRSNKRPRATASALVIPST